MAGNEELFQKAMNQGHSAAWDGMWDQASFFYRQALEQYPDNPKALTNLGLAMVELQQFEDALNCYRRAAVIAPDDPLPVEKVAQLSERLGRLNDATRASLQAADLYIKNHEVDKAIENWLRVTRFNPDHLTAHSRLAMVYERLGRKAEAVSEYLAVASLVQHGGDMVKAAQAVNYAFMIMPESGEARQALSMLKANQMLPRPLRPRGGTGPVLMAKVRQLETAGANQEEAPRLDPIAEARQNALVSLAGVLFDQADEVNEGQANRRGLISITRGPGAPATEGSERSKMFTHLSQAIDYQTQEREDVAESEFEKSIAAGLTHPAAYFNLGLLQYRREQYEPALVNLRMAVKHPDFTMSSRLLMGAALKKLGRLNEAAVEYLGALKIADGATVLPQQANEMTQLYESLIDSQSQQTDKTACDNLCANIASLLERPDWKDQLSRARQQLPAQAEGSLPLPLAEMMLQSHSGRVIESLASIQRMIEKNQIRTASEEAFFALMYAPGYLPIHIQIGELLLKENHLQEAVQKLSLVAQVYSMRGETVQATQLLRCIMQLNPMDLLVRALLI
jgi:tetratricopeptide (TPR) repeat protein